MAVIQLDRNWIGCRHRERARSHTGSATIYRFLATANPCGSELARDGGGSACISLGCTAVFASRLAPTMGSEYDRENQAGCQAASRASFAPTGPAQTDLTGVRPGEPGRLLGRLGADVDLGRPVNHDGRTQALIRGHPGMDAGIAALGHGWPFAAGPRSNAGVRAHRA